MARTVGIGHQDFKRLIENDYFYIDKTGFIKEWWENGDAVTLITRPRRFGKTLAMSMVKHFFSVKYAGYGRLFEGFSIWEEERYRMLQGTYPVISLSFANIKGDNYQEACTEICTLIAREYARHRFLLEGDCLMEQEKELFREKVKKVGETDAASALNRLAEYLSRFYGKNVILLLDEYDTPMQEAYIKGYWEGLAGFTRKLFNAAFKTNPYLERAIMTGITRVSKESIFSDLNNLEVVTTTSEKYETAFGFTEHEVFVAMDEFGLSDKSNVKNWYDGFTFGQCKGIYNPWSILNYLDKRKFATYWANTSSNSLAGKLVREGSREVKKSFECLLQGGCLHTCIDEQVVYSQLDHDEAAIWGLLLASGYLKVMGYQGYDAGDVFRSPEYSLALTNHEVALMFRNMVHGWFSDGASDYNDFIKALLQGDKKAMNTYMNKVALATFSYFDTGRRPSAGAEPERFYHGFVLGLVVDLAGRYTVTSNRESGFGRYDIMLEPHDNQDNAVIIEFKVHDPEDETTLQETVTAALQQIEEKQYAAVLEAKGVVPGKIRKYGFAFEGKKVLIG